MGEKKRAKKPGSGRGNGKKSPKSNGSHGIKKQYLGAGARCRVTFRLPRQAAPDAKVVTVVGDFNNWNVTEAQMERLRSGDFKLTLELPSNKEYRFRYLIDFNRWENDWCADQYVPNPFGCDDSLVIV